MARTFLVLLLAVLAACARMAPPAPYELHGGPGAEGASALPGPHPDSIVVASGDTLYAIGRRYGLPVRAIIDANRLQPPYRLAAGLRLALPQVQTYRVHAGDTLAGVARRYGVDIARLAAENHLTPPYVIRTGTDLVLPSLAQTAEAVQPLETASAPGLAIPARVETAPAPLRESPLEAPVPPVRRVNMPEPSLTPAAPVPISAPPAPSGSPAIGAPAAPVANLPPPHMAPPSPSQADTAAAPKPAPASERLAALPHFPVPGHGFLWPVRGRIIASFGAGADGIHNDGINIAAPEGTPVVASEAGEVAYAGNELKGYGNLVLIKHPDGYVTAYAHNETLLVKRGDHVARGQPIARIGATGAVSEPQLHFEIRRGARALDPIQYLPAEAAAK